jgi:hypothetical protein
MLVCGKWIFKMHCATIKIKNKKILHTLGYAGSRALLEVATKTQFILEKMCCSWVLLDWIGQCSGPLADLCCQISSRRPLQAFFPTLFHLIRSLKSRFVDPLFFFLYFPCFSLSWNGPAHYHNFQVTTLTLGREWHT